MGASSGALYNKETQKQDGEKLCCPYGCFTSNALWSNVLLLYKKNHASWTSL